MQHAQTKAAPLPARSLQNSSPFLTRLCRLGAALSCSLALIACGSSADSSASTSAANTKKSVQTLRSSVVFFSSRFFAQ